MPGTTGSWRRRLDRTAEAENSRSQREQESSDGNTSPDSSYASATSLLPTRKRAVLGSSSGVNTPPRSTWSGAIVNTSIPPPRAPVASSSSIPGPSFSQWLGFAAPLPHARLVPKESDPSPQARFFANATAASLALGSPRSSYNAQSWAEIGDRRRMRDDIEEKLELIGGHPGLGEAESDEQQDDESNADEESAEETHLAPSTPGDLGFNAAFEHEMSRNLERLGSDAASVSVQDASSLDATPPVLFSLGADTSAKDSSSLNGDVSTPIERRIRTLERQLAGRRAALAVDSQTPSSRRPLKPLPSSRTLDALATAKREEKGDNAPHKRRVSRAKDLAAEPPVSPVASASWQEVSEDAQIDELTQERERLTDILKSKQLVHDVFKARFEALGLGILGEDTPESRQLIRAMSDAKFGPPKAHVQGEEASEPAGSKAIEAYDPEASFSARAERLFDIIQNATPAASAPEPPAPKGSETETESLAAPPRIIVGPAPPLPAALTAPAHTRSARRAANSKAQKQVLVPTRREDLWPAPEKKYPMTVEHMYEKARTLHAAGVPLSPSMQRVVDSHRKLEELRRSYPSTSAVSPRSTKPCTCKVGTREHSNEMLEVFEKHSQEKPELLATLAKHRRMLERPGDESKIGAILIALRGVRYCSFFSTEELAVHQKMCDSVGVSLPTTWGKELEASLVLVDPILALLEGAAEDESIDSSFHRISTGIRECLIDLLDEFVDLARMLQHVHRQRVSDFVKALTLPPRMSGRKGINEAVASLADKQLSNGFFLVAYEAARALCESLSAKIVKETLPLALALDTSLLQLALRIVAAASMRVHAFRIERKADSQAEPADTSVPSSFKGLLDEAKSLERLFNQFEGASSSASEASTATDVEAETKPEPTKSALRRAQRRQQKTARDGSPGSATLLGEPGPDHYIMKALPFNRRFMRTRMCIMLQFLIGHMFPNGSLKAAMERGGLTNDETDVGANCTLGISEICSTVMAPALRKLQLYEHNHQDRSAAMLLAAGVAVRSILTRFEFRESDAAAFGYTVASEAGLRRLFATVERQLDTLERHHGAETLTFFRELEASTISQERVEVSIELYRGVDLKGAVLSVLKLLSELVSALLKAQVASHMEKDRAILKREANYELDPWDVDDRLSENSLEMRRSKLFDGGVGPDLSLEALCVALPQVFCDTLEQEEVPQASKVRIHLKKNPHAPKAHATKIKHSAGRSRRPAV